VQALLLTEPLHGLQANRAMRGDLWEQIDCYDLALEAIDTVVDHMGLGVPTTREQCADALARYAGDLHPDAPAGELRAIAVEVLERLIARRSGTYMPAGSDRAHLFDFALLEEHPSLDGGVQLTATIAAVNVLVGGLDLDVASAQAASEAKVENLIRRRRFGDAVDAAREARLRSIQYAIEVQRIITDTRRDVRRAGWNASIPARLNEMLEHVSERTDAEQRMLEALRGERDELVTGELADQTSDLIETLTECFNRHRDLHRLLLEARATFHAEQHQQAFAPRRPTREFDVTDDVLEPLATMTIADATPIIDPLLARIFGPSRSPSFRFAHVLNMLLADPRASDGEGGETPADDLIDVAELLRYSEAELARAAQLIDAVEAPVVLSELLAGADSRNVEELVAFAALSTLEPVTAADGTVLVGLDTGESLATPGFAGADLLLVRIAPPRDEVHQ
jgi:hypothetical protein